MLGMQLDSPLAGGKGRQVNRDPKELPGLGRSELLRMIETLLKECREMHENLSATQARCTALVEEIRELRAKVSP